MQHDVGQGGMNCKIRYTIEFSVPASARPIVPTFLITMAGKVIILTGASRGIGLAVAHYLLKASHNLVVVSRSQGPLEELDKQYPGQVKVRRFPNPSCHSFLTP